MIELGLAVTIGFIDAVVDDPILTTVGVDVETVGNADVLNNAICIAVVLAAHQLNAAGVVFIQDQVIKNGTST